MTTPQEIETLEAIKAAEAAGTDPFGDDDQGEAPAVDAVDEQDEEPKAEQPADEVQDGEPKAEDEPEPAPEKPEPVVAEKPQKEDVQQFRVNAPESYREQRAALMKEKSDAMAKLMDGEISAADFAAIDVKVADSLEELASARIRAETLAEANAQNQQQYQHRSLKRLVDRVKTDVDYANDADARSSFDIALQAVSSQANGMDFADMAEKAHTLVLAMRGVSKPAAAPKATPERKPAGTPPVTLRSLPSASTPNTGGVVEQLGRLKGPEYEQAFNKLTPAQKSALLDEV